LLAKFGAKWEPKSNEQFASKMGCQKSKIISKMGIVTIKIDY